jgi:hypothetical protein
MLLIFALSMLAAVLSFATAASWESVAQPVFGLTLMAFLGGILIRGIRKPVV